MAKQIKVVGYINVDDLPDEWVDEDDSTGLTAEGYDFVIGIAKDSTRPNEGDLTIGLLEDLELRLEG